MRARPVLRRGLFAAVTAGLVLPAGAAAAVTMESPETPGHVVITSSGASDTIVISDNGTDLVHNPLGSAFASDLDFDSSTPGTQTRPANGTVRWSFRGNEGDDALIFATRHVDHLTAGAGGGDDTIVGTPRGDIINAESGDDLVAGGGGFDDINGEFGNDRIVWNVGDGTEPPHGGSGDDVLAITGSPNIGDLFTIQPGPGGVNIIQGNPPYARLTVNDVEVARFDTLGGNDRVVGRSNLAGAIALEVHGGTGRDIINGTDSPDLLIGGENNDEVAGGGSDDRLVGGRGNDELRGDAGDDTLVWKHGDGRDTMTGGADDDTAEVSGSPRVADVFNLRPIFSGPNPVSNGGLLEITSPTAATILMREIEDLDARGLAGADTFEAGNLLHFFVTFRGGSGADTFRGGDGAEVFFGGSGNDFADPGGRSDTLFMQSGVDTVDVVDGQKDLVDCGPSGGGGVADGRPSGAPPAPSIGPIDDVTGCDGIRYVDR